MTLMGFMDGSKSVRYYDAKNRSIKVSRNVAFNENDEPKELEDFAKIPGLQAEGENSKGPPSQTEPETTPKNPTSSTNIPETPEAPRLRSRTTQIDYRKLDNPKSRLPSLRHTSQSLVPPPNVTRPTEASKAKNKNQEQANFALENLYDKILEDIEYSFSTSNQDEPKTVEEALGGPDAEKWKEAMETEMGTIEKMGTWKLEELPADRETIGNKWVFLWKQDENGNIVCFKLGLSHRIFLRNQGQIIQAMGPLHWSCGLKL